MICWNCVPIYCYFCCHCVYCWEVLPRQRSLINRRYCMKPKKTNSPCRLCCFGLNRNK